MVLLYRAKRLLAQSRGREDAPAADYLLADEVGRTPCFASPLTVSSRQLHGEEEHGSGTVASERRVTCLCGGGLLGEAIWCVASDRRTAVLHLMPSGGTPAARQGVVSPGRRRPLVPRMADVEKGR